MTGFQLARLALVSNCRLALVSNWRDLAQTLLVCRNLKYTKWDRTIILFLCHSCNYVYTDNTSNTRNKEAIWFYAVYCTDCKNHFPQVVDQVKIEIDQSSMNMNLGLDTYFGLEEIGDYDCQM